MFLCVFFFIVYWGYVRAFDFPRIGLHLGSGFKLALEGGCGRISFILYWGGLGAPDFPQIGFVCVGLRACGGGWGHLGSY